MITAGEIQWALWNELRSGSEIVLPNYTPTGWHESDVWSVTKRGYAVEHEIKLSVDDFRADRYKQSRERRRWFEGTDGTMQTELIPARAKHDRLVDGDTAGPTRFWFVLPAEVAAKVTVPEWAGIKIARLCARTVFVHVERSAPKLHKAKVSDNVRQQMLITCYWRFWTERGRVRQVLRDKRKAELFV